MLFTYVAGILLRLIFCYVFFINLSTQNLSLVRHSSKLITIFAIFYIPVPTLLEMHPNKERLHFIKHMIQYLAFIGFGNYACSMWHIVPTNEGVRGTHASGVILDTECQKWEGK
jgi:hypothetical protein